MYYVFNDSPRARLSDNDYIGEAETLAGAKEVAATAGVRNMTIFKDDPDVVYHTSDGGRTYTSEKA